MKRGFKLAGLIVLAWLLVACGSGQAPVSRGTIEVMVSGVASAQVTLAAAGVALETRTVSAGVPERFENLAPGIYTLTAAPQEGFVVPAVGRADILGGETERVTLEFVTATALNLARANPNLTTFVQAVEAAGLAEALQGEGPLTVFAPTNEAFAAWAEAHGAPVGGPLELEGLRDLLLYHVVGEALPAAGLADREFGLLETQEGSRLAFYAEDEAIFFNADAMVTSAAAAATNGVLYIVDAVMAPLDATAEVALTGEAEVPAVATDASGRAIVFLRGEELTVFGGFEGLVVTGAHIHGPATATETAGVLHPLVYANDTGTLTAMLTLRPEELDWLMNGLLYINLHSADYPAGELRGQIVVLEAVVPQ